MHLLNDAPLHPTSLKLRWVSRGTPLRQVSAGQAPHSSDGIGTTWGGRGGGN